MQIHSVGIDLDKTTFHPVALERPARCLCVRSSRKRQLLAYTANMQDNADRPGSLLWSAFSRTCPAEQGHNVRLIAAQFVKPFVKSNKNDFIDAEAIAEAVERKNMRFVPIKTDDQLDLKPFTESVIA